MALTSVTLNRVGWPSHLWQACAPTLPLKLTVIHQSFVVSSVFPLGLGLGWQFSAPCVLYCMHLYASFLRHYFFTFHLWKIPVCFTFCWAAFHQPICADITSCGHLDVISVCELALVAFFLVLWWYLCVFVIMTASHWDCLSIQNLCLCCVWFTLCVWLLTFQKQNTMNTQCRSSRTICVGVGVQVCDHGELLF